MTHSAKPNWWIVSAIVVSIAALLLGANYWIAGPLLLNLMLCAYPQSYETTREGLVVRTALGRQFIPYEAIVWIGLSADNPGRMPRPFDRVCIQYGCRSELRIAPADPEAFFADMEKHTPHLSKRTQNFVASLA
jgi:hypothetical protein